MPDGPKEIGGSLHSSELIARIEPLWRLMAPGPHQMLQHPAFLDLAAFCQARYGGGEKVAFSLHQALLSIGIPCRLGNRADLSPTPIQAAATLHQGLAITSRTIRHLAPLDMADDLPALSFGKCRLERFGQDELATLFDAPRLARLYPRIGLDAKRLSQFHWLVVEERRDVDPRLEARSVPLMFESLDRDFGAIDPHQSRYPATVEQAFFHILCAPWEEWVSDPGLDWRPFRVPWVYTLDADICARPLRPPDPDTLSWEPWIVDDGWGEEVELERPSELPLARGAEQAPDVLNAASWKVCEHALAGPLFETPVLHFFVRAFLSDGIDEFMAHLTTIEAALGLEEDHFKGRRRQPDPDPKLRSTGRIVARIAALTGDVAVARGFGDLFDLRSKFIHGRKPVGVIPAAQRVAARRLARRVVEGLLVHSGAFGKTREGFLFDLLRTGAAML